MMIYLICIIEAFLCLYLQYSFFNPEFNTQFILYSALVSLIFCIPYNYIILVLYITLSYIYLNKYLNKNNTDIFLYSLFSIIPLFIGDLFQKSFLPWVYPYYNNYFERLVIQIFITIFFLKIICPISNHLPRIIISNITLGSLSLLTISLVFSKVALGNQLYGFEIIIGTLSIAFLAYLIIKYLLFFSESSAQLNNLQLNQKKIKYTNYNYASIVSMYEKSNKLNHNTKYMLLNIKLMLNKGLVEDATSYINSNLESTTNNQTILTNNPYLDYTINDFCDDMKTRNINCTTNIFIKENSFFDNPSLEDELNKYFNDLKAYCTYIKPKDISLIIQEKGDFLTTKCIYQNITNNKININYDTQISDDMIIIKKVFNN